jgi:pimeloyl-ACP methyl ester carboxylesterase
VVGQSLGALVALALARRVPERVPALVLVDPPLDAGRPNPDVEVVYRLRHAPPGELERYLLEQAGNAPAVARALAGVFRQAADGPFQAQLADERGAPWAWEVAPHLRQRVLVAQADPAAGGLLGDAAAGAFVARLPAGTLHRFPGATHAIHASQPAPLAAAIRAFLSPP